MNIKFQQLIPANFHNQSKVWIYQSSRPFLSNEVSAIKMQLKDFAVNWQSHGIAVKAFADVFFDQFIVLMADETQTGVGGCSTDSSVRLIKNIEQEFGLRLFDRQTLAFIINNSIELLPLSQLNAAVQAGKLTGETLYFNNTVLTKEQILQEWILPVKMSWLAKRVSFSDLVA